MIKYIQKYRYLLIFIYFYNLINLIRSIVTQDLNLFLYLISNQIALAYLISEIYFFLALKLDEKQSLKKYYKAIFFNPLSAKVYANIGNIYSNKNNWKIAKTNFKLALLLNNKSNAGNNGLGFYYLLIKKYHKAYDHFNKAYTLNNDKKFENIDKIIKIKSNKILHDIEQIKYLEKKFKLDLSNDLKKLFFLKKKIDESDTLEINKENKNLLPSNFCKNTYHKKFNLNNQNLLKSQNFKQLNNNYFSKKPNIIIIDNFLTDEALSFFYEFCLESTIWNDFSKSRGYLGSYLDDGFISPALFNLSKELENNLKKIISNNKLIYAWGFKYDSNLKGINIHCDSAKVNVNFWVTPDSANKNKESGGIVIYDKPAPIEWDKDDKFNSQDIIKDFLDKNNAKKIKIPYKQNRCVIFDSRLFHKTDNYDFKDGYENKRINITLLYGSESLKSY